jgi:hypothetical protein
MNGTKYDVNKGMWDPAARRLIFPGEDQLQEGPVERGMLTLYSEGR